MFIFFWFDAPKLHWAFEASASGGLRINLGHLGIFDVLRKPDTRAFCFRKDSHHQWLFPVVSKTAPQDIKAKPTKSAARDSRNGMLLSAVKTNARQVGWAGVMRLENWPSSQAV